MELLEASRKWEEGADLNERLARWLREMGLAFGETGHDRSAVHYRKEAHRLRLEAETGKEHCPCCLIPVDHCEKQRR